MRRLKFYILIFCLAVSLPLAYLVVRTYAGLAREERAQMQFFSEALFDRMEKDLADLVQREENRSVEQYHHTLAENGDDFVGAAPRPRSPLARTPVETYILGYLQNNPDGSFQTPLVGDLSRVPSEYRSTVNRLEETNRVFNRKKFMLLSRTAGRSNVAEDAVENEKTVEADREKKEPVKKEKADFADRFLTRSKSRSARDYLGQKEIRVEELSARQALNMAPDEASELAPAAPQSALEQPPPQQAGRSPAEIENSKPQTFRELKFQVEVAPFQSVFITEDTLFIFRRVAINNQIYRQGFVLMMRPFLEHLARVHFDSQPLAEFSSLQLQITDHGRPTPVVRSGALIQTAIFSAERTFPAPFGFIGATLQAESIPPTPTRRSLTVALWIFAITMVAGLVAIYQSARTQVDLSERRSHFVSSVTHELKTPLTNIRMYIEMLEQGIAATPEREQTYLSILNSESARLSRLINNVLELSKLEKRQRHFHLQKGDLNDVLTETAAVMSGKLTREGFTLDIQVSDVPPFAYDREVLIQILVNLIENSLKFGKGAVQRRIAIRADRKDEYVRIAVSDSGPGIPKHALKKVFDDFYRGDNDATRGTGGTGIGLALVKKFMQAMGGRVQAANNADAGCTISLYLPIESAAACAE